VSEAVITGMGVLAPTGLGHDQHWAATLALRSGISRITRFDPTPYRSTLAGQTPLPDWGSCWSRICFRRPTT
jgi:act minimal PKS chain-length factor (CLF/KS beta)